MAASNFFEPSVAFSNTLNFQFQGLCKLVIYANLSGYLRFYQLVAKRFRLLFYQSFFLQEMGSYFGNGLLFIIGFIIQFLHGVFVKCAGKFV